MTNPNRPINPISSDVYSNEKGITTREYFAAMAMQGMLAKIQQSYGLPNVNKESMEERLKTEQQFIHDVAIKAVRYSDALISALNKSHDTNTTI
jgi:hypothetical protein